MGIVDQSIGSIADCNLIFLLFDSAQLISQRSLKCFG